MASNSAWELILGVEGGATKTDWVYLSHSNGNVTELNRGQLPKANFKLISTQDLTCLLSKLPINATKVGLFLAGVINDADRDNLQKLAIKIWPRAQIICGNDRESGFAAAFDDLNSPGILVICGTGSSVTGRNEYGENINVGGKGQIVGDEGSAYHIAVGGLKLIMRRYDSKNSDCQLTKTILAELLLNDVGQLIDWIQKADKSAIARLSSTVFDVYKATNDVQILKILKKGVRALARHVKVAADQLQVSNPTIVLKGSMFTKQQIYADLFREAVNSLLITAKVQISNNSGALGAAKISANFDIKLQENSIHKESENEQLSEMITANTEQRNDRSSNLDQMSPTELVNLFVEEEMFVYEALQKCRPQLSAAIEIVSKALANGGRLFYVGAGTSGRLGVLDASEIPPTFGEPTTTVQGIIAGGVEALYRSIEGVEDSLSMGISAITNRGVDSNDVVCGISASGRTPFVLGALDEAKRIGSSTIFINCNLNCNSNGIHDVNIVLETGAELLTGSTRLKAGTATKVALNIITTCTMIKLGKVKSNLMISMKATNVKLKDRATRLVAMVRQCSYEKALEILKMCQWDVASIIQHSNLELDQLLVTSTHNQNR
ncbi:hypothetical protein CHUAL_008377 [Chamberlinius hualienensis]